MKYVVLALAALACIAAASQNDELIVTNVKLTVPENGPVVVVRDAPVEPPKNIDISTIIAIGKAVWEIVKDGKPVVDYKTDWAGAVPQGVSWSSLEGFKDARWGPFQWEFENVFTTTVKFHWYFAWSCKGSYNGHGAFIMNAGASVEEIYAAWGFTVGVTCTVDSNPVNYGSKVDPIAGLAVEVTLSVSTVLQSYTERCRVSLRGNCEGAIFSCA